MDYSILQDELNNGIEKSRRPPEKFTILNTCLTSIFNLGWHCSRVSPEEMIPVNDMVVKLNKVK
jgi:hypothetical protein